MVKGPSPQEPSPLPSPRGRGGEVAIVGAAESDRIGNVPDKSALQLHAEAALNALDEAGLKLSDVDGMFTAGVPTTEVAEYLGFAPRYTDGKIGRASCRERVGTSGVG